MISNYEKTTPYSPWANGEIERFNRSMKKVNQCAHAEKKDRRAELDKFLLLYRTSPHQTTNVQPATLLFNRHIRNGIPQFIENKIIKAKPIKLILSEKRKIKST